MNAGQRLLSLAAAGTAVLGGLLTAGPSVHADMWCFDDPVVQVNDTTAAINVGLHGDPGDVGGKVWTIHIIVFVPRHASNKVVSSTSQYFNEDVHFVPSPDGKHAGDVVVGFTGPSARSARSAVVQVTVNGVTTTTYGTTLPGLYTHFAVQ